MPNQLCALSGASASSFNLLTLPNGELIEEAHYVVRNSSTHALFGFCSTYYYPRTSTGMIGSIFVEPSKRNLSIGHSLHQRAVRGLLQNPSIQKVQLGVGLPGVYLGIPMSDLSEGARLKRWFAAEGWDISCPNLLYTLTIRNLAAWLPPDGLLPRIQRVSFAFDLIHGTENADAVLSHVEAHSAPEVLALYRLALSDPSACGIVRAKSPVDGALVGTIIISRPGNILSQFLPALHSAGDSVGGILAPVVPSSPQSCTVLQGLALLGIRQNKAHRVNVGVLSWVSGEERDVLLGMGFDVLYAWEQLSSDAGRFNGMSFG